MPDKTILLFISALLLHVHIALSQTFPCSGDFIISIYQLGEAPTTSYEIDYNGQEVSFTPIVSTDLVFNSAGFNRLDNFIYAAQIYTNNILRVKSDGTYEVVGSEDQLVEWESAAGDVNRDGIFVLQDRAEFKLYFYEVSEQFNRVNEVNMLWHPSTGLEGRCELPLDDVVFDPSDPNVLFAYQRAWPSQGFPNQPADTRGYLIKINTDFQSPEFGMVEIVAPVDDSIVIHLGGLFFDAKKELYAYGSVVPGPILEQKKLIRIDKLTGETTLIGEGPIATGVDGCSCPYTLDLEKTVKKNIITCADEYIQFEFELNNSAEIDFDDLVFADTFPAGMEIVSVEPENPLSVSPSPGTGIGTNILHYQNAFQAANAKTSFTVRVKNPGTSTSFCNQAFLQVPDDFGGTVLSDDPNTNVFSDSSCVEVTAFDLSEAMFTAIQPKNCLSQDDGEIRIVSNLFNEGNTFLVSYLLDGILQGPFAIEAMDGFLIIPNLEPGLYTDITIGSSIEETCFSILPGSVGLFVPLGIPDINIDAVQEFCEQSGQEILLSTEGAVENANFLWTGPNGFQSNDPIVNLGVAMTEHSGTYYVEAEKDSCYVFDSLQLLVRPIPGIDINLLNEEDPCELKSLQLQSNTILTEIDWMPAAMLSCEDCPNPSILTLNDATFQVQVSDQFGCQNEASFEFENILQKSVYIPNSFSPNGDGINDYFNIHTNCTIETILRFQVYDRWGNLLFENQNFDPNFEQSGWDGKFQSKELNTGVYVYWTEVLYIDGSQEIFKGDFSLLR